MASALLKLTDVQLGVSGTTTNNFTMYQPSTPDGTVRWGVGNSGSVTDIVTLNSSGNTGFGTTSPAAKIDVYSTSAEIVRVQGGTSTTGIIRFADTTNTNIGYFGRANTSDLYIWQQASGGAVRFGTENTQKMMIDSSGNLGLGVTPSAWSGFRALQVGGATSIWSTTSGAGSSFYSNNVYFNGSNRIRLNAGYATEYIQDSSAGQHIWFNAASSTAGSTISFTQAMTLDASGRLLVGKTSTDANNWGIQNYSTAGAYQSGIQLTYGGVGASAMWVPSGAGLAFGVDGASGTTERMRIDSSGNVTINATSNAGWGGKLYVKQSDATQWGGLNVVASANVNGVALGHNGTNAYLSVSYASGGSYTPLIFDVGGSERMRLDTSGNLLFNSGYGSVATAYGCRAWVNFNGTGTVAIRASGNVTSITDNGTGAYVVNMTTAMPDTNYAPISCGNNTAGTAAQNSMYNSTPVTTSTFTVNIVTNGGGPRDDAVVTSAVFR